MKAKFIQENSIDKKAGQKFWLNPVLQAIIENPEFHKELRKRNIVFSGDEDVLKRIYLDLKNQDVYLESVNLVEHNPNIALEVITFILKNYTNNFAILQGHLEETYYNWADDKKIVIQLAIKSIQNFILKKKNSFLLTDLMDQEVEQFAKDLLTLNIEKREHLDSILIPKLTKWEPSQIAMLDYIVLRMAISEFLYFPTIPSLVTINEYIDLTKTYSTPQSKKLINGVLDFVYDEIVKEGIVKKDEFPRKK
jgi:N utilization substance protein B